MRLGRTIVVSNAGVEIQLSLDHLAVHIWDGCLQDVIVFDTDILGGGVERHLNGFRVGEIREVLYGC